MSGPKRNPDYTNTIGIVVVGICGAVLVYVTIVALQAFYMNDTAGIQHTADYGGQESAAKTLRSDQMQHIGEVGANQGSPTYRIPIEVAMQLVVKDAKTDPSHLIPALPASTKRTIEPVFGRPSIGGAAPAAGAGSAAPAPEQGAGSAAPAGAGSAAAAPAEGQTGSTQAPLVPTGAGQGASPVAGAGSLPSGNATRGATTTGAGSTTTSTGNATTPKAGATEKKTGTATEKKAATGTEKKAGAGAGSGAKAGGK